MIYLRDELKPLFRQEQSVADFLRIEGEVYKHVVQSRRTLRFERGDRAFFLKAHWGVGWKEIIKNITALRWPVLGASNEWRAIQALEKIGIATMRIAAYGQEGLNPASLKSFLVTDALENTEDLEHWLPRWQQQGNAPEVLRMKRAVLHKVATIARQLHGYGMNHRDFYLCHFRLQLDANGEVTGKQNPSIYLMDLHRAQIRRRTPLRWVIKDIAGLLYSSLYASKGLVLTRSDYLRFVRSYIGSDWRTDLRHRRRFWQRIIRRAIRSEMRSTKTQPVVPRFLLQALQ